MKNTILLKLKSLLIIIIFDVFSLNAQTEIIPLWKKIPDEIISSDYQEKEIKENGTTLSKSFVTKPTLSVYLPKENNLNRPAIIIFPGGGYTGLSVDLGDNKIAQWLNNLGIVAIILRYRLPSDIIMKNKSVGPLQDAQEAIRYVRAYAQKWNIDTSKIGVLGFSAGGHVASTVSTHFDDKVYDSDYKTSARPDFSILVYPVISMDSLIAHKGSKNRLLGSQPSQELVDWFSNEKRVTTATPHTFLVHATDDEKVIPENSIRYYLALKEKSVSAELHLYEKGGHGFSLGSKDTSLYWTKDCENWLRANKYIN